MSNTGIKSNFAWKLAERLFARGIEFVVSIIIARILSPEDYGIVAMVLVFITIADVFVTTCFSSALIQNKDADDTDFSTVFYCSTLVSLIIYLGIFVSAPIISDFYDTPKLTLVTRIFALKIPLSVYNAIQHAYVSRHMLFKRFFMSTLVGTILSAIVGITMAYKGFGVWALIAQYFVNTVGDTLVLAITVPWRPYLLFSYDRAKKLMGYGWKILVSDLFGVFFGQLRSLIIGKYFNASSLAIYNKGQQLPTLVYQNIGNSITSVLFPVLSNYSNDCPKIKELTRRTTRLLAYILFPLFTILIITAKPLIVLLLTEKWIESAPFVQLLALDYCIAIWGIGILPAIKASGRSDIILKSEFIKKPIFLILLFIGVKTGLIAVAVTMVVYEFVGTIVNGIYSKNVISYSLTESIRDICKPLSYSVISGMVSFIIGYNIDSEIMSVLTQTFMCIGIYVVISFFDKNETFVYIINITKKKYAKQAN